MVVATQVREESTDLVAYHAGIGLGLVTAIRGARLRLARGECSIPKELIPEFPYHKLSHDDPKSVLTDEERQALKDAVQHMVNIASSHLSNQRISKI